MYEVVDASCTPNIARDWLRSVAVPAKFCLMFYFWLVLLKIDI